MVSKNLPVPDTYIISLLVKNDPSAWEHVYGKYAPMMYGTILNMTDDRTMAEEIFNESFRELREKKILSQMYAALCHCLLRHTYRLTIKHLKARGLKPLNAQPLNGSYPLIHLLCFKTVTLNEAAAKSGLAVEEVPRKLRAEFKHLRNQSVQKIMAPELSLFGLRKRQYVQHVETKHPNLTVSLAL